MFCLNKFSPYLFFILFFCSGTFLLPAQQREIDSLNAVIKNGNDTSVALAQMQLLKLMYPSNPDTVIPMCKKVRAFTDERIGKANAKEKRALLLCKSASFSNTGVYYLQRGQMDSGVHYLELGLKVAEEIGDGKEIANSINNIAAAQFKRGETEKALGYLFRALKIQQKLNEKVGMAFTVNNIGQIYEAQGQTRPALEWYFRGLKMQEQQGNKIGIGSSMNNIAALYMKQGELDKALEYFNVSLTARKEAGDKRGMGQCLNNMGTIYMKKGELAKALDHYNQATALFREVGFKQGIASALNNIAGIQSAEGKLQEALKNYEESFSVCELIEDKKGMATALNNIGFNLLMQSQAAKARGYSQRSLRLAEASGYAESMRDAHLALSRIDSALGKSADAYAHYKQYIVFRDSVLNQDTRKAGIKKQFQYEYEKKEEAAKLAAEKKEMLRQEEMKRQKQMMWWTAGTIALTLLIILLLVNRSRLRQKHRHQQELNQKQKEQANAVMETQELERKRIAEDLHDSLGHLLSTAKLNLQTLPGGQKQVESSLQLLNQASEEIRNITFNLMPRALEEEGLVPALRELAAKVTNTGRVKVQLHVHNIDHVILEKQSQFNIYRIVQEAVNNILKHAEATEISIQLIGQSDHLTIMIEDDGKGFDTGSKKNGRGLKNIVTRSLWLNGHINIDSTPGRGTTITTEIPT